MATSASALLAALMVLPASGAVLKVGGLIQKTSIGPRGQYAFEMWKDWANAASLSYTVETSFVDYDGLSDEEITTAVESMTKPGTCESTDFGCVNVLVCPYTTGASKKVIAAVEAASKIAIMVWGGATDSIFTDTCTDRMCFGGFTVASMYMAPSLKAVSDASGTDLTVASITNNNGFSRAVTAGGKAYVELDSKLTLAKEIELSVAKTSLAEADETAIAEIVAMKPDIVMISGHPGDVEEVIMEIRKTTYTPKAIVATNAFSSMDGNDVEDMYGVIMPEQWAESPTMKDSIVGWTSADFTAAMTAASHTASYHAASAGGLAVMLAHAMAADDTPSEIATSLAGLPATDTFYGKIDWNTDGSIDAALKPMYGKQAQRAAGYQIVAPTGPLKYPIPQLLKVGGPIQKTSIGPRGQFAFELWRDWTNSMDMPYTVETLFVDYDGLSDEEITAAVESMTKPGTCESSDFGCVDVLVCPYTTGASKKVIAAVPAGSKIAIMVWGGATDSIFTDTCTDRMCFGAFTVASMYMTPSLKAVSDMVASGEELTVASITNNNGFSRAVTAGGKAFIESDAKLTLAKEVELTVAKTSLAAEDETAIAEIVSMMPDVVMISGHPGDVEEVIMAVRKTKTYVPKAIIATNAFSSMDGNAHEDLTGVIMPEQWAESPTMKDSIVGWTSADFKGALVQYEHTPSYHAAAAGGLAVMLSHAMAADSTPSEIATTLAGLPPTDTFYGTIDFNADGSIMSAMKPMYGKQAQGAMYGYQIVAPTGPLMYPLEQPMTCGEVKEAYRSSNCCGSPSTLFSMAKGRRLDTLKQEDDESFFDAIQERFELAKKKGPAEAAAFTKKIKSLLS